MTEAEREAVDLAVFDPCGGPAMTCVRVPGGRLPSPSSGSASRTAPARRSPATCGLPLPRPAAGVFTRVVEDPCDLRRPGLVLQRGKRADRPRRGMPRRVVPRCRLVESEAEGCGKPAGSPSFSLPPGALGLRECAWVRLQKYEGVRGGKL